MRTPRRYRRSRVSSFGASCAPCSCSDRSNRCCIWPMIAAGSSTRYDISNTCTILSRMSSSSRVNWMSVTTPDPFILSSRMPSSRPGTQESTSSLGDTTRPPRRSSGRRRCPTARDTASTPIGERYPLVPDRSASALRPLRPRSSRRCAYSSRDGRNVVNLGVCLSASAGRGRARRARRRRRGARCPPGARGSRRAAARRAGTPPTRRAAARRRARDGAGG